MAIDVTEHIEDIFDFLRKLKSKGEYKIFHIPLDMNVYNIIRSPSPLIYSRKRVGHIHYFTKDTALEMLKECEYEIVDLFFTAGSLELSKQGISKMKLPRKILWKFLPEYAARLLGGFSLMVLAK